MKNTNLLVDIFKNFPQILNPALTYSLSNIHSRNATDAKLVVNALAYIFYNVYDRPDMGIEQRDYIAQPLADFLNSPRWNNISKFNFIYQGEVWPVASKIVYLAGCSGKVHEGAGDIDHLKNRMIEGIPGLFRDLKAESEHRIGYSDLDDIKMYWILGFYLLAANGARV